MITLLVVSTALLAVLIVTYAHLPFWLQRLLMAVPPWMQAAILHLGYATWIGGVLGHLVGGLISLPWLLICLLWFRPRIQAAVAKSRAIRSVSESQWRRSKRNVKFRLLAMKV
jgi:hypothetical protein